MIDKKGGDTEESTREQVKLIFARMADRNLGIERETLPLLIQLSK